MRAPLTVNCSILLTHLPLLKRPQAARESGFGAVEFWWPFSAAVPSDREVNTFIRSVRDAGVRLSSLNFAAGDLAAGERGLLSNPSRSTEFRDNIDVTLGIGEQLGARVFNALYGNRRSDVQESAQDELALENLALAGERAARFGATVVVEPVSGIASYPLKRAHDAVDVIGRVQRRYGVKLGLLADFYHLAVSGDSVPQVVEDYSHLIAHVQVADAPGRGMPGSGTLPLATWVEALVERGYKGMVSLEYMPCDDNPFAWLTPTLH
ncbi:TIM barrel protein [Hoyosella rhizosphaerae]|uniref:Hydroxypyruvate isomerase n=1 Tax=Hoyosella rhizosphaerae TaxID=1755582 RepID=A0A916UH52_9ACTN|nr:TIM barrel protein [Hoyosella rhizosphaerae]MBN4928243.1 TIM barrel protein [Hoyosella rhizosphaerae]GGC73498.1 hydroxypyruvate isomerase [Hoyosella rhizosphaerae]